FGEGLEGVTVGADGSVYAAGATYSGDFPHTFDAQQPTNRGNGDLFAVRFSSDLRTLSYATFVGGTGPDYGRSAAVSASGQLIVAGQTQSNDWPIVSAGQTARAGDWDAVVAIVQFAGAATPTPTPTATPAPAS